MVLKLRIEELIAEKSARDGVELTAHAVSQAIGVSHNTILAYIRGNARQPSLEVLGKLAKYFGCEPGELFEYDPEQMSAALSPV